jgi:hypothetical protein
VDFVILESDWRHVARHRCDNLNMLLVMLDEMGHRRGLVELCADIEKTKCREIKDHLASFGNFTAEADHTSLIIYDNTSSHFLPRLSSSASFEGNGVRAGAPR